MNRKQALFSFLFVMFLLVPAVSLGVRLAAAQSGGRANLQPAAGISVGASFTYQGHLTDDGAPANGVYDLRFFLYDAETGGAQVGGPLTVNDLSVVVGLFTVELDFGEVFDGRALWLEARVRPGDSTGAFTALSPRQALTAAPYALSLRPGAVISGTVPLGTGALNLYSSADGLRVQSAGDDGVYVASAGGDGVRVFSAGGDGVYVFSAGGDGVDVFSAGGDGVYVDSAGFAGVRVDSAGFDGVYVGSATYDDGFDLNGAGDNGIEVSNAANWAGFFDGDINVTGSCTGCTLAAFGLNTGDAPLQPGDPVAILGVQPSPFDGTSMLMDLAPARPGQALAGVVQGRAEVYLDHEEPETEQASQRLVPRQGAAAPGDYLIVVIYGPVQVQAGTDGPIRTGTRLALGPDGLVRPLRSVTVDGVELAESAPILGVALDAPSADGLVWVLVNPH